MDKDVVGFFLPITVHAICCLINFRNFIMGNVTWVNVLAGVCYMLFGFVFAALARRWPCAVAVLTGLAGLLLLSCVLVLVSEFALPGLLPFLMLLIFVFGPPLNAVFHLFLNGTATWMAMALFALVWLVYLFCLRRSIRTSE